MKLLHTTDLHFHTTWYKWIASQEIFYDVICLSGDLLDTSNGISIELQKEWVLSCILKIKKPLFVCSGNHDIEDDIDLKWLKTLSKHDFYFDNSIKSIENIKIGCVSYMNIDGYYDFNECDILLNHEPPANLDVAIEKNKDLGNKELYRVLKNKIIQPRLILSGHIHNPKKTTSKINSTIVYNPGYKRDQEIPNHNIIEINKEKI